ncbi:MAG: hypothetical protein OXC17_01815 [Aestuariivita sp.]|nr:hypothetical protein [Aestuariivita sp.]
MTYSITEGYLIQKIEKAANGEDPDCDSSTAKMYIVKFRALESHFFNEVHSLVDAGLALDSLASNPDRQEPNIMTIHGCRHVSDLIESLDKLAHSIDNRRNTTPISALEAYFLLCAAHLHDAGNIAGRDKHQHRSGDLIRDHKDLFYDTETRQTVFNITRVHTGNSRNFGQDTLRELQEDDYPYPRSRLLASLLRVADELSENPERVPDKLIRWFKTSPASEFAYRYAEAFRRFNLEGDTLVIWLRTFPKQHRFSAIVDGQTMNFFNHLEKKIDVIEREVRYCSQYGRPDFDVGRIRISIDYHSEPFPSDCTKSSTLTLDLRYGYPDLTKPLLSRCSELSETQSLESFVRGQDEQSI